MVDPSQPYPDMDKSESSDENSFDYATFPNGIYEGTVIEWTKGVSSGAKTAGAIQYVAKIAFKNHLGQTSMVKEYITFYETIMWKVVSFFKSTGLVAEDANNIPFPVNKVVANKTKVVAKLFVDEFVSRTDGRTLMSNKIKGFIFPSLAEEALIKQAGKPYIPVVNAPTQASQTPPVAQAMTQTQAPAEDFGSGVALEDDCPF